MCSSPSLATAGTGALLIARERARTEPEVTPPSPSGLTLLVVRTDGGSVPVVVGSTGFGTSGALVVPPAALLVIPGQGESSVREALELPSRQAATAVGNLLGVRIEDHATIEADRLAAIADESGGAGSAGTWSTAAAARACSRRRRPATSRDCRS